MSEETKETKAAEAETSGQEAAKAEETQAAQEETTAEEHGAAAAAKIGLEELEEEEAKKAAKKAGRDPKDREIAELKDRLMRNLAEFENFRKRTEKEKAAMFDMGAKSILEKFLPVVDNFERSLQSAPDLPEAKAYADGMEMIYRQLMKGLEEAGVKPMDAKGKPFDPNLHNAVMHVDDESLGENVVAEEFQKGYYYRESVLRHSMVKVAN